MTLFWQAVACALIAAVLCTVLSAQGKDMTLLLTLGAAAMVLLAAVRFLEPVVELAQTLRSAGELDPELLQTILKAVGLGLVVELASLICADAGNSALARAVEMVGAAAILWLSIPMMTTLLELVQQMAGGV